MTQRRIKFIVIAGLMVGGLSACDSTWQGVYLNSDVLDGRSDGFTPSSSGRGSKSNGVQDSAVSSVSNVSTIESASAVQTTALNEVAAQGEAVAQTVTSQAVATGVAAPTASAPSFSGGASTVAGLGDPGRAGLWMETPLVSDKRNARITAPNGQSVVVTLEPMSGDQGAGSRLSIGAMRALGLPLTELVKVSVGPA